MTKTHINYVRNEGRLRKKTGETLHQYLKEQSEVINSSLDNCHKQREQTMEGKNNFVFLII